MKIDVCGIGRLNVGNVSSVEEAIEIGGGRQLPHERRPGDLANNCAALYHILISGQCTNYGLVTDYFSGIGLWATVVRYVLPEAELELVDYDKACCNQLKRAFPDCEVTCADSFQLLERVISEPNTLSLLDLTKCTWLSLRRSRWWSSLLVGSGDVVLSDCAGAKIHLNYRSYGLKNPSYLEYLELYAEWLLSATTYRVAKVITCGGEVRPRSAYLLLTLRPGDKYSWRNSIERMYGNRLELVK